MAFLDRLLYSVGLNVDEFRASASDVKRQLRDIGETATKTFERDIQTRLAKAISPANFSADFDKAKQVIKSFGITTTDIFEKQVGRTISKGFFDANKEALGFFTQLTRGSSTLSSFGAIASGVGTGVIAAELVKGLASAGKEAIKFAADFELALARVQTIAGKDFNLDAVRKEIEDISTRIPQDVIVLTSGLTDIIGSGFDKTSDALKLLETSSKAAVAGFTETKTAAGGIVTILNAFGKTAADAAHVSDVLFKTVDEGVITFEDLATQIGEVATPAKLAGISLEEIGAAIATSTRAGINAAETMTGLKNAIIAIVSPTAGAAKAAKELGLDFSQAGIAAAGGFKEFVSLIAQATKGDIRKLREIFPEQRALREIAILAGTLNEQFQSLSESFLNTAETAGATDRAFAIVNDTAQKQFELFKNNLSVAVLNVGRSLLDFLEPAIKAVNKAFAGTTEIEETTERLKKLGLAAEQIGFRQLVESSHKAREEAAKLRDQYAELIADTSKLGEIARVVAPDLALRAAFDDRAVKNIQTLTETEGGRILIQEQINRSKEKAVELEATLGQIESGNLRENKDAVSTLLRQELDRADILQSVLDKQKEITAADAESKKLAEQINDSIKGRKAAQEDAAKSQRDSTEATKEESAERKKIAEQAQKFIDDALRQLELLNQTSDISKRLIQIRQEADERRKLFAENAQAIKAVYALERAEIAKTLDAAVKKINTQIRGTQGTAKSITEALKLELKTDIALEIGDTKIDVSGIEALSGKLRDALSTIAFPVASFITDMRNLGIATDDELIALTSLLDKGLGNVVSSLLNFVNIVTSPGGTIVGAILGGIGLLKSIGGLFGLFGGGGDDVAKRLEAERRQREASEAAARAAEKAAQALEDLRRAAQDFGAGQLTEDLAALNDEIRNITGSTRDLTDEEIKRAIALRDEISNIETVIAGLQEEARHTTDPERLREIQEEIQRLTNDIETNVNALRGLGILNDITPLELERLRTLSQEKGILEDAIKRFKAFGDNLRGLIDKLDIEFEIKGITDGAEKLKRLLDELANTFGFKVPAQFKNLNDFILAGLDALEAGGQQLIDFLLGANLEELTAQEFADLLRLLKQFSDAADNITGDTGDKLAALFDRLALEFDLLNITDPAEQLARVRDAINQTFGAEIPHSVEAMRNFVRKGFAALTGDADALKEFLAEFHLGDLTKEQLQELLKNLDGFLDNLGDSFQTLVDRLNLEFNLLDVDDPIEKLKRFRDEIKKKFGAIIPETQEGIDGLIKQGLAALLAGGDALKNFLKSINLEELTADQFKDFLEFLKGIADEAKKKAGEISGGEEQIGTSIVKSITFQQANVMLNELATIREVLTQMLDVLRGSIHTTGPQTFADRRIVEGLDLIFNAAAQTNIKLDALTTQIEIVRDILRQTFELSEEERAIDISTTSPDRIIIDRLSTLLSETIIGNDILSKGITEIVSAIESPKSALVAAGIASNFGMDNSLSLLRSMDDISRAQYEASLQANVFLAQMAGEISNRRNGISSNIFIIKGDSVTQVGVDDLEEIDRKLIEKSIIASRSRGVT